jgi:2-haloacid dehalogenase
MSKITTVVFDVGKVLFEWDLRHLFAKLITDKTELEYFVTHVVTPQWHYQHDAGRSLDDMVAERIAPSAPPTSNRVRQSPHGTR